MYSESRIQMMISVPSMDDKAAYCKMLLDELRRLVDVIQTSISVVDEEWMIWPLEDPASDMRVYSYASPSFDNWLQDKPNMCIDCACIEVKVGCQIKQKKQRFITAFARVHDLRPVSEPFSELEIRMEIPRSLWKEMDLDAFVERVQETCCTLGATYAAIDQEWLCPNCVSDSPFMYFSSNNGDNSRYMRYIPAVCWAQFLPISRISNYESVMACSISYCMLKPIQHGTRNYVWIQFFADVWKPSVEDRIAFRKYLSSSFPELDFQKLAEHSSIRQYQEEIYWMPLIENEQKSLNLYKKT